MMMYRCHLENSFAGQLKRADLQDYGERFHDKHTAHNNEDQFVASDYRHRAKRSAERERTNVAHEYLCRVSIKPKEPKTGAKKTTRKDNHLARARNIRNLQVARKFDMSR